MKSIPNIIVVGSGFSGSVIARKIAEELDLPVTIIERRSHIAGNMYDEFDENGILIQKYGPHFINTNNYNVILYLSQYSKLVKHDPKLLSFIDGEYVRLPFNFKTAQQLLGDEKSISVISKLRRMFKGRDRVPVYELLDSGDEEIVNFANLVIDKGYRNYVAKQWGLQPEKVDRYIFQRNPIVMSFDERYLAGDFQYIPENGYTELFNRLLDHPNIKVRLNCDVREKMLLDEASHTIFYDGKKVDLLVYTGAIDELFDYKYGDLPYRSLRFDYQYYDKPSVLPSEIVAFPEAEGYTRRTEYRKVNNQIECTSSKSVVITEYPKAYDRKGNDDPYYPIVNPENTDRYQKYEEEAKNYGNVVLCGRLAEFKYYNMDICIEHALEKYDLIKNKLQEL